MKNITHRFLLGLSLMGTMAVAPLATSTAQAAPPDHAPAYGRRAKDWDRNDDRYDRDRYDNDRNYRERYDRDHKNRNNVTFSGTVSNVRSGRIFDLRANGRTYNVYTSSLPRRLSEGDEVRVYGRPYGVNDIRNASVVIIRNDRDNNGRDNETGAYRTFRGVVTSLRNDREFDIRIGGTTYNVYSASGTRGLNVGDEVRVYGQRYGDNDIRNANTTITRNR